MVDFAKSKGLSKFGALVPRGTYGERAGNALPGIVPSNTYPTRDGKHVIIGANLDAIFKRMMHLIGACCVACIQQGKKCAMYYSA